MKLNFFYIVVLLSVFSFASCKKQKLEQVPLADFQITNAVIGGTALKLGTNVDAININSATRFGVRTGNQELKVVAINSPGTIYYNATANFEVGAVYSLFLCGSVSAVDAVMVTDNIPYRADESFGIRFVNLSPDSGPISVNLSNEAKGSLADQLAYKAITDFKSIAAPATETSWTFEFRNATTGDLLTTITLSDADAPLYRNATLAFAGPVAAPNIIRINNY